LRLPRDRWERRAHVAPSHPCCLATRVYESHPLGLTPAVPWASGPRAGAGRGRSPELRRQPPEGPRHPRVRPRRSRPLHAEPQLTPASSGQEAPATQLLVRVWRRGALSVRAEQAEGRHAGRGPPSAPRGCSLCQRPLPIPAWYGPAARGAGRRAPQRRPRKASAMTPPLAMTPKQMRTALWTGTLKASLGSSGSHRLQLGQRPEHVLAPRSP